MIERRNWITLYPCPSEGITSLTIQPVHAGPAIEGRAQNRWGSFVLGFMSRCKKPIRQQLAEGDPRKIGKRKLLAMASAEPKTIRGLPPAPSHLVGVARRQYEFWRDQLAVGDLDHQPDGAQLEGAALAYQRALQADRCLQREGLMIRQPIFSRDGDEVGTKTMANPAFQVWSEAWKLVHRFCTEFGFSPASRARLSTKPREENQTDLMALLTGPRPERKEVVQ